MQKFLLPLIAVLCLSGCAQVELASHLWKTSDEEERGSAQLAQQGNFKVGKPYTVLGQTYVPREKYEYSETGIASWYGPGFHGNKTASGETYDKYEMTAAHRTLQMPSLVRVTNLDNGRSVIVRVNDRGPFAKGRIIDISKRAAEQLNMIGTGTARVKVDLLAQESRIIADAARRGVSTKGVEIAMNETGQLPAHMFPTHQPQYIETAGGPVGGHMKNGVFYPEDTVQQLAPVRTQLFVQAGAYSDQNNALRMVQKLSSIGPAQIEPVQYSGRTLYKVRIGPLDTVQSADNVLSRVLAQGQSDAIIVVQ